MSYTMIDGINIFYERAGSGPCLLILHGNTVSSKMHTALFDNLKEYYNVISLDLPGHGKSDRLQEWPIHFWHWQAQFLTKFMKAINVHQYSILGYSGGALIAFNLLFLQPDRIKSVIADSFLGLESEIDTVENIDAERAHAKHLPEVREFWKNMHGNDWENIIDQDTNMIKKHHAQYKKYVFGDLSKITTKVFITGSKNDSMVPRMEDVLNQLKQKNPNFTTILYENGNHPACLTVMDEYIQDVQNFFNQLD